MNSSENFHYQMKECDRAHICHKFYDPEKPHDSYRRFDYHGYDFDESSGLSEEEIIKGLHALSEELKDVPHPVSKARAIAYLLDHTRIEVSDFDWYVGIYSWGRVIKKDFLDRWQDDVMTKFLPEVQEEISLLYASGTADIWPDYDHAVPDWDSVMQLGFSGMLARTEAIRSENEKVAPLTEAQKAYYDSIEITLAAILRLIRRFIDYAATRKGEKIGKIIACLETLEKGAPTTTYEALQLMYLFFMMSESVDCYQVRSLGNGFDRVISPFYFNDLRNHTATKEELDDYIAYFLMQFYAIGNYWGQPLFLGGTDSDGSTRYNAFSTRVLSIWDDLDIHNPKIQVLFSESTPKEVRYQIYDIIRRGKYMTVVCEKGAAMGVKLAADCTDEEAADFIVSGCYEPLVRGGTLIECGYPNALKCVSLALRDGFDSMTKKQVGPHTGVEFPDFESLYEAFDQQLGNLLDRIKRISGAFESYFSYANPAILLSATREWSLLRMEDGYAAAYPYSFSLLELSAYASAVDALLAVKYLVYDKKIVSLSELVHALDADWEGYESLRNTVRSACPKYGNGLPGADEMGRRVSDSIAKHILNHPNCRGSKFLVEYHGAMTYAWQGTRTEATPDGRKMGDELSKNATPSIGADKNGATAFILSCTASVTPAHAPAGFNADVMLHPSALEGEEGLAALDALISVYAKRNGIDIQFNVVSPETLKDAQLHPERYRNLQIRVSGWNVLWNDIPRELQNSYIIRAENARGY